MSNDLIPILCFGAGGHAAVVESAVIKGGEFYIVGFIDDNVDKNVKLIHANVVGGRDELPKFLENNICKMHIAVGNNLTRQKITADMTNSGFKIISLAHPTAIAELKSQIGCGSFLAAQSVVGARAKIGKGCIINTAAVVDHDCVLDDFVHICPGAHIAGEVKIGECSMIGTGASVIPGIKIGKNCVIGAGAVVIKDVNDNVKVVGNPAKILI